MILKYVTLGILLKFKSVSMSSHQQRFFDNQVHMPQWKKSMSGKNENLVIKLLESLSFKEGEDYQRQFPFANNFVADFAFVKEQVVIEVDGENHRSKKQREKDKQRDNFFIESGWEVLRIDDRNLFGEKMSFYKNLIKEIVKERRRQYNRGEIMKYDQLTFKD